MGNVDRHSLTTNRLRKQGPSVPTLNRRTPGLSVRTVVFLLLNGVAIAWLVHVASLPGSGLVRMGLVFLVVACIFIYFGFVRADPYRPQIRLTEDDYLYASTCGSAQAADVYLKMSAPRNTRTLAAFFYRDARRKAQTLAGLYLVLALGCVYMGRQVEGGQQVIARWITPYPNITDITGIPPIHKQDVFGAIIKTADPPAKVHAFYTDSSHYSGWNLVAQGPLLTFKKPHYSLDLWITPERGGTSIIYQLERSKN